MLWMLLSGLLFLLWMVLLAVRIIIRMERRGRQPVQRSRNRRVTTDDEYWRERHATAEVTPARAPSGRGDEAAPPE
jgi:uncharacterized membrane protein